METYFGLVKINPGFQQLNIKVITGCSIFPEKSINVPDAVFIAKNITKNI